MENNERLKYLIFKIKSKTATSSEKKEYLDLMKDLGYIKAEDYNKSKKEIESNEFWEGILGLGLAVLIGAAIVELFNSKK
jgi:hypothetical protein